MDSHSRSASPRDQPRPIHRPPSPPTPPSPRLPPAAFDNQGYQHDDADPNHNESFSSNSPQQNGHNKETTNVDSKALEAVNLELINMTPKNGNVKKGKDVEVDMNGSNPYDEYFVPVNEHRKYMRGEKLYVTADKRGEKSGGCKRPLCWTLLGLVVAAIVAVIVLAATGVLQVSSETVSPYNSSLSEARAFGGIVHNHEHNHNHEHEPESSQNPTANESPSVETQSTESIENNNSSMYIPRTVEGELKIDNENFLESYNDTESDAYREFTDSFSNALKRAVFDRDTLERGDQDITVNVIKLRPGSVLVTYRISWKSRFNAEPMEDLLTPSSLDSNLNSYLARNNRMISVYHIADDDMATNRVLDLCQINKNGCEYECEFEESTLDFSCTCPSGQIVNMANAKTCISYVENPGPTEHNESSIEDEETNQKEFNNIPLNANQTAERKIEETKSSVINSAQGNSFDWQQVRPELSTEKEYDPDTSGNTSHEDSESNEETTYKSDVEPKPTTLPEPFQTSEHHTPKPEPTSQTESVKSGPPSDQEPAIEPETEIQPEYTSPPEFVTEPETVLQPEPSPQPEPSTQPEPSAEVKDSIKQEPGIDLQFKPIQQTELTQQQESTTHNVPTPEPEPQFTPKQPEATSETSPKLESSERDISVEIRATEKSFDHSIHETEIKPSHSFHMVNSKQNNEEYHPPTEMNINQNNETTEIASDHEKEFNTQYESQFVKITMPNLDTATTTAPKIDHPFSYQSTMYPQDETSSKDTSLEEAIREQFAFKPRNQSTPSNQYELENKESLLNENQTRKIQPYDQNSQFLETTTIAEIHSDKETSKNKIGLENIFMDTTTTFSTMKETKIEDDDWLESFDDDKKNGTEEIFSKNIMDYLPTGLVSKLPENTTSPVYNETKEKFLTLMTSSSDSSTLKNDKLMDNDDAFLLQHNEGLNNSINKNIPVVSLAEVVSSINNSTDMKEENKTSLDRKIIPSFLGETMQIDSKETMDATVVSMPETTEHSTSKYYNPLDEVLMEVYNHSIISETTTESSEKDNEDGSEVTFDAINTLYNRSSKAMQSNINQSSKENETITTLHLDTPPTLTTDSDWLTENFTESNYEAGMNKMTTSDTTESSVSKLDIINSSGNKEDFEPDYLNNMGSHANKMTDSEEPTYTIMHDYDSDDSRVKRVKESKEYASTVMPEDKLENHVTTVSLFEPFYNSSKKSNSTDIIITSPSTMTAKELSENENDSVTEISNSMFSNNNDSMSTNISSSEVITFRSSTVEPTTILIENVNVEKSNPKVEKTESRNQNATEMNNLGVKLYEISSHDVVNNTFVLPNSTIPHSSEYEDHETEMNPFLPETENNKSLVKKLQEGHDLEPINLNETQNENIEEHAGNSTETSVSNNETLVTLLKTTTDIMNNTDASKSIDKTNMNTDGILEKNSNDTTVSSTSTEYNMSTENTTKPENTSEDISNKSEESNEKPTISTFLIDTDDLDIHKNHTDRQNEIERTTGHSVKKISNVDRSDFLSVVPISKEDNYKMLSSEQNSKSDNNDLNDALNKSERTFEGSNANTVLNNVVIF